MQRKRSVVGFLVVRSGEVIHKEFHKGQTVFPMFGAMVLIMLPNGRDLGQIRQHWSKSY
jgi:hypothetical protein